jgi:transketolase
MSELNIIQDRTQMFDCRDAFACRLEAIASQDSRIVVVVNDSIGSSKVGNFNKTFPDRLINVGIAEQNMIGLSAGLANGGKIPFVCAASCFLTGRGLEQIKADIAYSFANVKLCGMSSGVAYGELGPTHHSIEDLAWLRVIANMMIIVPADPIETAQAVQAAYNYNGPVFLRISRMPVPIIYSDTYQFRIGKASLLRDGPDLTIITNGTLLHVALSAADLLSDNGIHARVLNMATVSPLDQEAVISAARETGAILTVEEASIYGGLGGAVAEVVVCNHPVPMRIMGFPEFAPTGSAKFLFEYYHLTPQGIFSAAQDLIKEK